MKWSVNLGRVAGIRILVHWTFAILLFLVILSGVDKGDPVATIALTIAYVLSIFLCVVLHELGHALTARTFGIQTKTIMLLPVGGIANLERMPHDPKQEFLIALAGPAVNVAIALLLYPFTGGMEGALAGEEFLRVITPQNFLSTVFFINVLLVVFNAIPAFPMDGGRVLRALLAMVMNRTRATGIAALLGQVIAVGFCIAGFFYNPFLIVIGVLVFLGAYSENAIVHRLEALKGHQASEAMITLFTKHSPRDTVEEVAKTMIAGQESYGTVMEQEELIGVVSKDTLINALNQGKGASPVSGFMHTDFETVSPEENLSDVVMKIYQNRQSIFPVTYNGRSLMGLVTGESVRDFLRIHSLQA